MSERGMDIALAKMETLLEIASEIKADESAEHFRVLQQAATHGKLGPFEVMNEILKEYVELIDRIGDVCERLRLKYDEEFRRET